jgi:cytochrome c553
MTVHTLHADSHEAGLATGCPRCHEHSLYPEQSLDRANLARLLRGDVFTPLDEVAASKLRSAVATGRYLEEIIGERAHA